MKRTPRWAIVLAMFHLGLVIAGACHLEFSRSWRPIGSLLGFYGNLSGADTSYGFFAPSVAPQLRATFTLTDAAGRQWTTTHDLGKTREANLRLSSTISLVTHDNLRDPILLSWAASMFGRYPTAQKVEVRIEVLELPRMDYYRAGWRPRWSPSYEATFERETPA